MPHFHNHSKRLWTEDECRNMLNAALLYLVSKSGGALVIDTEEMLKACEELGQGGVVMSMSDDDKTLTITKSRSS